MVLSVCMDSPGSSTLKFQYFWQHLKAALCFTCSSVNHQSVKQAKIEVHCPNVQFCPVEASGRAHFCSSLMLKQRVSSWLSWPGGPTAATPGQVAGMQWQTHSWRPQPTHYTHIHTPLSILRPLTAQDSFPGRSQTTFLTNVCAAQLCVQSVLIKWFMTVFTVHISSSDRAGTVALGFDSFKRYGCINHTHSLIQVRIFFLYVSLVKHRLISQWIKHTLTPS